MYLQRTSALVLSIVIVGSIGAITPSTAYSLDLSADEVQEALSYGERHRDPRLGTLNIPRDSPYVRLLASPGEPVERVGVVWVTPFLAIAQSRAQSGRPLTPQEVSRLLDDARQSVRLTVVVQTTQELQPPAVRILIQRGDGSVVSPERTERSRSAYDTPRGLYVMNIQAWFPYASGLSPKESVRVIVGWAERSFMAEFNLDTLR